MTDLKTRVAELIYAAAIPRLQRHFTAAQSEVLATLMVAQSQYESAAYTSAVYKANNNAFGYKFYSGSIYQVGQGSAAPASEGDSYALFASVEDSAREVADWIGRRSPGFANVANVTNYANAMSGYGYYTQAAADYAAGMGVYYTPTII